MGIRRASPSQPAQASQTRPGPDPVLAVLQAARSGGVSVRTAAQNRPDLDTTALATALSDLSGLPVLTEYDVEWAEASFIRPVPMTMAREHGMLPLYVEDDGTLLVGIADLAALPRLDALRTLLDHPVRAVVMPVDVLDQGINKAWNKAAQDAQSVLEEAEGGQDEEEGDLFLDEADLLDDPNEAPIIRFVNALLTQAIKERASDIHIEPFEKALKVRFRVDGVLHETSSRPTSSRTASSPGSRSWRA